MKPSYLPRYIDRELDSWAAELPAVLLDGPKGVGKTETALIRAASSLRCDVPAIGTSMESAPDEVIARAEKPVLIDEWHRAPSSWDAVKRAVDAGAQPGDYILTGSLPPGGTHSGAGRIANLQMRPMTLPERGLTTPSIILSDLLAGEKVAEGEQSSFLQADYLEAILQSGFPGIFRQSGPVRDRLLDSYLERIVDTDFHELGLQVRRPQLVFNWLRAYAAATGSTTSWETIRDAASAGTNSPARSTVAPYIDLLSKLRILDQVEPWLPGNLGLRQLMQSPKHYLVEPALAARLLGVNAQNGLQHSAIGSLFENLVALSLRVFAPFATLHHFRTQNGRHEVDFVIKRQDGKVVLVEVKWGTAVRDEDLSALAKLRDHLGDSVIDVLVITTGPVAYRARSGVLVTPLALLG